jgi:hypothetical protein
MKEVCNNIDGNINPSHNTDIIDDSDDYNIPGWKKSQHFLKENPNVLIETGKDGTGNILQLENFVYCKEKYAKYQKIVQTKINALEETSQLSEETLALLEARYSTNQAFLDKVFGKDKCKA